MKCPVCEREEKESETHEGHTLSQLLAYWYGHVLDPNTHLTEYACTRGHTFVHARNEREGYCRVGEGTLRDGFKE